MNYLRWYFIDYLSPLLDDPRYKWEVRRIYFDTTEKAEYKEAVQKIRECGLLRNHGELYS